MSLSLNSGGNFYTNGIGYSLGISGGGGSGAAATFDVIGGHVTNLILTNGGSGYTSAPTLSFAAAGGGSGVNVTISMAGKCCVDVTNSGNHSVTTKLPGATPLTTSVGVTCGRDNGVNVSFPANSLGTVCINFTHCGYATGGDTIVISKGGTPVTTITTNGSGQACSLLGTGTYTYVLTTPQGLTKSGGFTVLACTTTNVNAGGSITKQCIGISYQVPIPCEGTLRIRIIPGGAILGTGTIAASVPVFGGAFHHSLGCATIPETLAGSIDVAFTYEYPNADPPEQGGSTGSPIACHDEASPFFAVGPDHPC